VDALPFCASHVWVLCGVGWSRVDSLGVGCAYKVCFRGVLYDGVFGGGVAVACVVCWFPWRVCDLLRSCVCCKVVCGLWCGWWSVLPLWCVGGVLVLLGEVGGYG